MSMEYAAAPSGTLTLTGEGQTRAKPDIATIRLGVITTGATAEEAVASNAQRMGRVIESIKALSVPEEDLQTTGFRISPIVDYDEKSPSFGEIVGYRIEDALSIRVEAGKAATVLDAGVGAGANVGGSLSYGVADEAWYRRRALEAAIQSARSDADVIARGMGVTLVGARAAEVIYGGTPIFLRSSARENAALTPLEPGSLTISASVRMVYEYRSGVEHVPRYADEKNLIAVDVSDRFAIALEANHATGYRWQLLSPVGSSAVKLLSTTYEAEGRLPGEAGTEVWTFRAAQAGKAAIAFRYVRTWGVEAPAGNRRTFQVIVQQHGERVGLETRTA